MSDVSSEFALIDDQIEEFLARYRRGERPSLTEYTSKYPDLAERILALFPALIALEAIGSSAGDVSAFAEAQAGEDVATPERLGDYLLLRRVGAGGMGIVYEAIQESLGRHVALKTLPSQHLADATRLERFRREARAAAAASARSYRSRLRRWRARWCALLHDAIHQGPRPRRGAPRDWATEE